MVNTTSGIERLILARIFQVGNCSVGPMLETPCLMLRQVFRLDQTVGPEIGI
jgi:hypothetical protein